jgi:hypothetical protein
MEQKGRSLDVPEKIMAESGTGGSTFDQPGKIRHHQPSFTGQIDHAKLWTESREGIIRDFRSCLRHSGKHRRLAGIGQTDQSDVRDQFQFKSNLELDGLFALFELARCLVGRSREMDVTAPPLASRGSHETLSFVNDVDQKLIVGGVVDLTSQRQWKLEGLSSFSVARLLASLLTILGGDETSTCVACQRVEMWITHEHDITAIATVTAVGPTFGDSLGMVQTVGTITALAGADSERGVINKHSRPPNTGGDQDFERWVDDQAR